MLKVLTQFFAISGEIALAKGEGTLKVFVLLNALLLNGEYGVFHSEYLTFL